MKIVSASSVEYLRWQPGDTRNFPNPWEATHEQLRSVPYIAECWYDGKRFVDYDFDTERIVVTFDELLADFEKWDQTVEECPYSDVYEYLGDCIDNGLHPCKLL